MRKEGFWEQWFWPKRAFWSTCTFQAPWFLFYFYILFLLRASVWYAPNGHACAPDARVLQLFFSFFGFFFCKFLFFFFIFWHPLLYTFLSVNNVLFFLLFGPFHFYFVVFYKIIKVFIYFSKISKFLTKTSFIKNILILFVICCEFIYLFFYGSDK